MLRGMQYIPQTSRRADNVVMSPMRKFAPMIRAAEERGVEVIKLNIGDPDLETPAEFFRALSSEPRKTLPYAPSSGLPAHVAAWKKYYADFGVAIEPANIIPTVGGAEAILMSLAAVADPDDEVLVFEPLYSGFRSTAAILNIKLVPVPLRFEDGFALPPLAMMEALVTEKTKAVIVINPDNPTGKSWTLEELELIVKFAEAHNLFVISDETYREIVFETGPFCILQMPEARERAIVIDSLSKRFSAPGARIGAIVSYHEGVMRAALKFAMARLSAPTLEQIAFIPLLQNAKQFVAPIVVEYKQRRDALCDALKKIPDVKCHVPGGAFYVVAQLPVDDATAFVTFLINDFSRDNKTAMITPIADFYATPGAGKNEVRIACVRDVETLKEAASLIADALAEFQKPHFNA